MGGPPRDVPPGDDDGACVGAEQARDAPEERRLACTVRADQARERASLDPQVDTVDRRDCPEQLRDAADLTGEVRGVGLVVDGLDYFENAAPKTALGLHDAMFPAHMLSIWIALWFLGPR